MALPNGDLITTPFDPQMAYPSDRRMQVDTLNSRDSISMFIRWEGMTVYVLENSKIYILQGGRSNEYWKELGAGSGTGGTTFVGQFATSDLLPTSGRSAGDYAFVGTGEDFVQYNWDNIANEWVMAEGQTDMASEFFHIGYKTPLRRPVIFPLFPKDILVEESGDFVFSPETSVARFIFTGEVEAIRGIETAAADRENKYVNRTGSDIILRDKASGIPSGSGMDFGGTDYTWVNGSEITLKGNGTYWELAPNNDVAFSDHIDSVNTDVDITTDNIEYIRNVIDRYTLEPISFKEVLSVPTVVDGIINIQKGSKYYKRVLKEYNLGAFNILPENSGSDNAANFAFSQTVVEHDCKHILPTGVYNIHDIEIIKSGIYDFSGVTFLNGHEIAGDALSINASAEYVEIIGLNIKYTGTLYTTNPDFAGVDGVNKYGIVANNKKTILTNCRASGFSLRGFQANATNKAFYLLNCTSNNNGYAGCGSNGSDFQVLGGEYSDNGGANSVRDGYGVIGNVSYNGNFKCIGVTAERNATRNIDSHQGLDIIIANNYTADAGQPYPQWFNKKATDGLNIRVTQRIDRAIITGNIAKRGTLAGISISGSPTDDFLRNILISNNICEDNRYQFYIRPLKTNKLKISGNQEINNLDVNNVVERGLLLSPQGNNDTLFLRDVDIAGNSFDSQSAFYLSSSTLPEKSNIRMGNNSFKESLFVDLQNVEANVNIFNNDLFSVNFTNGSNKSIVNFQGNTIDVRGTDTTFNIHSSFNGRIKNVGNVYKNSTSLTQIVIPSNSSFKNNTIIVNHEISTTANNSVIRGTGPNYEVVNNEVIFNGVTPFLRVFRFTVNSTVLIHSNNFNGLSRVDHSDGNISASKLTFDPNNKVFDFGTTSVPSLGDFTFPDGSVIKNNSGDLNTPSDWILFSGVAIPRGFTKKGVREQTATNPTVNTTAINYYNIYTGATAGGTFTVNTSTVPVGETFEGVVLGAPKTFVEGSGFTIIRPTGSSLTVNQNESFSLKFISDTQAVLTINKAIPDIPTILSSTATLDFPVIAAGETERLTATVTGADLLDPVLVSGPANIYNSNDSTIDGWVSAANTVTVRVRNNGASSIDPGEGEFKIKVFK